MDLRDRMDAAVKRAAARYCNKLTATTSDGTSIDLFAIKRVAEVDDVGVGNISARLFEFVVSPSSAATLLAAVGGSELDKKLAELRKITIREYNKDLQIAEYKINSARPLRDDAPAGGVLRLFAYLVKG